MIAEGAEGGVELSPSLGPNVPWRPHLYEPAANRGWYVLSTVPTTTLWAEIITAALARSAGLRIGLVLPKSALKIEEVLRRAAEFDAEILPFQTHGDDYAPLTISASAADWVIESHATLPHDLASFLLSREWGKTLGEPDPHRKGRLLERSTRLLFSQVNGWRVQGRAMRRLNQEIDIAAINDRAGGLLGAGNLVLGEAKNWANKVGPDEFTIFRNKMLRSNGMAKLGFLVSVNGFTRGVLTDAVSTSRENALIVLLSAQNFEATWRDFESISAGVEAMVYQALQDQRQLEF